ncbi:MAG: DUF72 domain-containing protein [Verrucomicrobiota bacterium]
MAKGRILVGTSGWVYKSWAESFYPPEIRPAAHLDYYATQFPTVEINASFYRLPSESAIAGWQRKAPPGFLYAVKAPRAITHFKKLKPGALSFDLFFERLPGFGENLGPVLWQLPGSFRKNVERLDSFLESIRNKPCGIGHAVEFRHASWFSEDVYEVLRRHRTALVSISTLALPMDLTLTADFTYVRFHGLEGGAAHDYTADELKPWAEHLRRCARQGRDAFVYFNNDINTRAPLNARMLMEMVGARYAPNVTQVSGL